MPCFPIFSMFFLDSPCFSVFCYVFPLLSLFSRVFLRFPLFSHVFLCFSSILPIFPCFSVFYYDSPCFSVSSAFFPLSPCLPMFSPDSHCLFDHMLKKQATLGDVNDNVLRNIYFNLRFCLKESFVILLIEAGMTFSKFSCCYLLCIRPLPRHCPWNGTLQTQSAQIKSWEPLEKLKCPKTFSS